MSMEMKDSGIAWIGEIPKHWDVTRLKFMLHGNLQYGANESGIIYDESLPRYVRITDIQDNSLREDVTKLSLTEEQANGFILKNNDILFARSGATVGKAFIYKELYGKCAFAGYLIKASVNEKNDARFVYYYTQGLSYDEWKKQVFIQATIQNIGADKYAQLPIPIPTKEEQSLIANFLDKKCAEIDELIALQEQMIAQLTTYKQAVITETVTKGLDPNVKMKDSGVEWIGEIPEHWDVCRLKYLTNGNLQYGANESGVTYDANLPRYVRITDILDNTLREDITKLSLTEEQAKDYILQNNDLLFARSGATVGKAFIYDELYGRCAFAGYLIRASINNENSAKFVYYYTQTSMYEEWKKQVFVQATIQNIGADKYAQLPIVTPSLSEQQSIANYLDQKCKEIDELISVKKEKIEKLKAYKKSVIYEYVTGKKQVN